MHGVSLHIRSVSMGSRRGHRSAGAGVASSFEQPDVSTETKLKFSLQEHCALLTTGHLCSHWSSHFLKMMQITMSYNRKNENFWYFLVFNTITLD